MNNTMEFEGKIVSSAIKLVSPDNYTFVTILVFNNENVAFIDALDVLVREYYTPLLPSEDLEPFKYEECRAKPGQSSDDIVQAKLATLKKDGYVIK